MNELVYLKNDEPVCSSLQVAEKFGKRHTHVIERIEKIIENDSTENSAQCFKASIYKDSTGKSNKMYVMNRDGFTFLVMGFTGKKANEWKWQYIKAFNQMEKFIREKQTKIWIETRKAGKLTRKAETDTIKNLVEYAKAQGSQHADKLYMTYSKLANKMAGVSKRDEATVMQLNNLSLMEHIILCVIDSGIVAGKHYKEIYQDCNEWRAMKARCNIPSCSNYEYYGGRGIKVCDEWINDFEAFKQWAIKNGYADKLTIDRIDVSGDYCPENCRWISFQENCWNRDKKPRKTNTSGYPGVMWRKDSEKWRAYITVDKKRINLGTYDRIEEALEARKTAEEKYWK